MELEKLRELTKDGKFFGIKFIKRTDGSLRTMCARVGVVADPHPQDTRNWRPEDKGLLQVWDTHKKAYRLIPADSVLELTIRGSRITA